MGRRTGRWVIMLSLLLVVSCDSPRPAPDPTAIPTDPPAATSTHEPTAATTATATVTLPPPPPAPTSTPEPAGTRPRPPRRHVRGNHRRRWRALLWVPSVVRQRWHRAWGACRRWPNAGQDRPQRRCPQHRAAPPFRYQPAHHTGRLEGTEGR